MPPETDDGGSPSIDGWVGDALDPTQSVWYCVTATHSGEATISGMRDPSNDILRPCVSSVSSKRIATSALAAW